MLYYPAFKISLMWATCCGVSCCLATSAWKGKGIALMLAKQGGNQQ